MSKDKLIKLSKEEEEALLDNLRDYMSEEFDLDIGNLPAKFLFDFMVDLIGYKIYNQAIDDAEPWLYERFMGILEDSHALKKD
ncbi:MULTISPECIES: DUF2164 domain-containing protein [unclassified Psychrobacter]|uniref:DUF2164 domain-containing protein n=1 Tax=unclassified Psychrobacter TaxID=196806 RepID=UPI0007141FF9|nr:DUF2164 domain-containing protein [Psychrobacter sp. P11F6]KRG33757.1 hypothetical protein AK822_01935 [Psychrobacter sp. P11F6]